MQNAHEAVADPLFHLHRAMRRSGALSGMPVQCLPEHLLAPRVECGRAVLGKDPAGIVADHGQQDVRIRMQRGQHGAGAVRVAEGQRGTHVLADHVGQLVQHAQRRPRLAQVGRVDRERRGNEQRECRTQTEQDNQFVADRNPVEH